MEPATDTGLIGKPSNHSVEETAGKLKGILHAKGVTLFAIIDHVEHRDDGSIGGAGRRLIRSGDALLRAIN